MPEYSEEYDPNFSELAAQAEASAESARKHSLYSALGSGALGGLSTVALFEGGLMTVDGVIGIATAAWLGRFATNRSHKVIEDKNRAVYYKYIASGPSQDG